MSVNYALGFHERWEVWLHARRVANLADGRLETPLQEQKALEVWLTVNRKKSHDAVLCPTCNEEIAEALLDGRDPFATPKFARDAIENFGKKCRRF